jgi:hypothetical protein
MFLSGGRPAVAVTVANFCLPSVILSEVPHGGAKSKDLLRSFIWPLRSL